MADTRTALEKMSRRKQAIQALCMGPDGQLTRNAKIVLGYLAKQCNADGTMTFPLDKNGQVDQTAMVRMAGRREVFDMLVRMLTINLEQRRNLGDET